MFGFFPENLTRYTKHFGESVSGLSRKFWFLWGVGGGCGEWQGGWTTCKKGDKRTRYIGESNGH